MLGKNLRNWSVFMPQKVNVKTDEGDFLAFYVQAIDGNPNALGL